MSLIQGNASKVNTQAFYTKTIDQSLRFEDGDGAYLRFTPTIAGGDAEKGSISLWVKRGNISTTQNLYSARTNADATYTLLFFQADNTLKLLNSGGASLVTNAVFRDPSAWYHIVLRYDTADATAADRAILYVNGVRQTVTGTNPTLNENFYYGYNGRDQSLGTQGSNTSQFLDSYLAEVHFTNGTAYTADDYGELRSGIWIPKSPSVTYGTHGFYLDFANSADIGNDVSGNNNDFTANNLVASDVVPDSPTNNFCTLNSVWHRDGGKTLSEGNLRFDKTANGWTNSPVAAATWWPSSGKWYWEFLCLSTGAQVAIRLGVGNNELDAYDAYDAFTYYSSNGQYDFDPNGADTSYGASWGLNDIIGVAYDADNGTIEFYKNNTSQGQKTGLFPLGELTPVAISYYSTDQGVFNFGQDSTFAGAVTAGGNTDASGIGDFKYAPPSGFLALCTSNLPDPAIDPAQDTTPEDHFNVVLWTGDTNNDRSITGVGFQPDLVWIKARSTSWGHWWYDVVRGTGKTIQSESTNFESVNYTYGYLDAFETDGFGLQAGATSDDAVNANTHTYVAWNWKAGGTGVSNTDGSITSTVSANTDAGFSIVSYTGNGTAGATVGHGLSSAPEMVITKTRTITGGWTTYHKGVASDAETDYLYLNTTAVAADYDGAWNDTAPSSSVVTLGSWGATNYSAQDFIMYCFHSVDGFSKCGSYIGNGSSDGPFIFTGHRSKFLLVKRTNGANSSWYIWDAERDPDNPAGLVLLPNGSGAEIDYTSTYPFDLLSNGFKVRATAAAFNNSGNNYIFYSAAEQPFKYSNAR